MGCACVCVRVFVFVFVQLLAGECACVYLLLFVSGLCVTGRACVRACACVCVCAFACGRVENTVWSCVDAWVPVHVLGFGVRASVCAGRVC